MPDNQFKNHREARAELNKLFAQPANVSAIHYSCESFYGLPDGRSPRITSIAVRNFATGQTVSFSIHQIAELSGTALTLDSMEPRYNAFEKKMLDEFYEYLSMCSAPSPVVPMMVGSRH